MAKTLFINEKKIYSLTPIEANVDVKILRPHILTSQDIDIQKVLGHKLYDELQQAIIDNAITENQSTLLDMIKPALAWFVYANALPFLFSKTTNKSIVNKSSDSSSSVDENTMLFMKTSALNKAEFYANEIVNYLKENQSLYPSYITDLTANKSTQYSSSIYLTPAEKSYSNYRGDRRDYL